MNRRNFLKAAGSSLILPMLPGVMSLAQAAGVPLTLTQRVLAYVGLYGGPDLRHLCPPVITQATDTQSYAYEFWKARARSFGIATANQNLKGFADHFAANYLTVNLPGTSTPAGFGIFKKADWLIEMWNAGHVAFVCNAIGAVSRDHAHAQLVLDHGDLTSTAADRLKPGWGGKLVELMGGSAKLAALTNAPKPFCFGPVNGAPKDHQNSRVLSVKNSRKMQLAEFRAAEQVGKEKWSNNALARALRSYYSAYNPVDAHYKVFKDHETKMRNFGNQLYTRLGDEKTGNIPVPDGIRQLYTAPVAGGTDYRLNSTYFGGQIRNLHDVIASADILGLRVAAMEYGGWDTHQGQVAGLDKNFSDLFGLSGGFGQLYANLAASAKDNLVITLAGEFGRQLASNGDNGTDHGRGGMVIVIGNHVKGGVYGTMFPASELSPTNKFVSKWGDDTVGLTSFEPIFGAVADWVAGSSTGNSIFPNRSSAIIESGVTLNTLFV